MIANNDQGQRIRDMIAERVEIEVLSNDRVNISTPFLYMDGDHCGFRLSQSANGTWVMSDRGGVFTHAGYAGVELQSTPIAEEFHRIARFYGIAEGNGELTLSVKNDDFGDAFFTLSQACIEMSRLALPTHGLPSELAIAPKAKSGDTAELAVKPKNEVPKRVQLTRRALAVARTIYPKVDVEENWVEDNTSDIPPVDLRISLEKKILYIFGIVSKPDCYRINTAALHYHNRGYHFKSIAVTEARQRTAARYARILDETKTEVFHTDKFGPNVLPAYLEGKN